MDNNSAHTSLDDFIVIELASGKLGKTKLRGLDALFLPISDEGKVVDLENEIYDLSAYLLTLSSDFAAGMQTIDELDKQFEKKSDTDYMTQNPDILKSDRIEEIIESSNLVTTDEVDEAYDASVDDLDLEFDKANNKIDNWFD